MFIELTSKTTKKQILVNINKIIYISNDRTYNDELEIVMLPSLLIMFDEHAVSVSETYEEIKNKIKEETKWANIKN